MRVVCMLREIMNELGLSKGELTKELKIDYRSLEKLLVDSDKDPWRLDRETLHRYMLFAHAHDFDAFQIAPHPIWRTFENNDDIAIFRGSNRADAPVEDYLNNYFARLHSTANSTMVSDGLGESMRQKNCVVIGSPKFNQASETALALLWGAEPFNESPENRQKIPLHFLGMKLDSPRKSAVLIESPRHGLDVRVPQAQHYSYLKVDWLPPESYRSSTKDGQEAAALVACYRPLGTQADVTTIVIAGYTGISTLEAAREATYKVIPDLSPAETPGEPCFAMLKFRYKKRAQRQKSPLDLRSVIEDTAQWGPQDGESFFLDGDSSACLPQGRRPSTRAASC